MSNPVDTTVEADFLPDGRVRPRAFTWQGRKQFVADIGRQWIEGQERHVLVMTDAHETFELCVTMPAMMWRVKAVGRPSAQV